MTGFTTSVLLYRNRVSLKEAFEGLELCEGKLSRTVLRGLDGSNPVRLLGPSFAWRRILVSAKNSRPSRKNATRTGHPVVGIGTKKTRRTRMSDPHDRIT